VWIVGLATAALALVDAVRGAVPLVLGVALYVAMVLQLRAMFRQVGRFGLVTALLYPLHLVVVLVVVARSAWLTYVRHAVRRRGRDIEVGADGR
jgi:4,4'-diaponeurosporenoate glycosyltransferase